MQELDILITKEGIKIEGQGYTGGACLKDLEKIQQELESHGIQLNEKTQKLKTEYYTQGIRSVTDTRSR